MLLLLRRHRTFGGFAVRSFSATARPPSSQQRAMRRRDSEFHHMPHNSKVNHNALAESLRARQAQASAKTLPWFFANFPEWYFDSVPESVQQHHLSALTGIREASMVPELTLRFENYITLVHPRNEPGRLNKMLDTLKQLGNNDGYDLGELESTQTYVAKDGSLTLNLFRFCRHAAAKAASVESAVPPSLQEYVDKLQSGEFDSELERHVDKNSPVLRNLAEQVSRCKPEHITNLSPRRALLQLAMVDQVVGTDCVATNMERNYAGVHGDTMLTVAATEVAPIAAMSRVARFLGALGIDISRVSIDIIHGVSVIKVLTTSFHHAAKGTTTTWDTTGAMHVEDLARVVKWIDDRVLQVFEKEAFANSLVFAEAAVALSDLTHGFMSPADPYQYARSRVLHMVTKENAAEGDLARELICHFLHKFSPRFQQQYPPASLEYDSTKMRNKINAKIENPANRAVLEKLQECIEGVVRTNLHLDKTRFALAMRLDPTKCHPPAELMQDREMPFGLFFASGRRFTGFHVRFRDIARGGLRLVCPANAELFSMETSRQYFECFDLAFAQQLKNKDIAEGGAKAVCVIEASELGPEDRFRALRSTAKAFADSVLDLLPPNSSDTEELVYFGPDENIIPADIEWIAQRAVERKYPIGGVVISSKANEGINHKHYGVTSEGVNVFMETALLQSGVDPRKQPFTVKLTGFGDVGGNLLKILHRDYGNNCRIVGISDATACAEDPQGLQWDELLRLFQEQKTLADMDPKLGLSSSEGKFGLASDQEGMLQRNTMHFRVKSDVFLPAGGRPAAINAHNWKQFLDESGKPSSPIIIEGANLFLTAPARKHLSLEGKCMIVKDSSANKCGVITSSYEVLGGMILSSEQFLAVKEEYVQQVLDRLRYLAKLEANILMREWGSGRAPVLPETCIALSHAMLRLADKMEAFQLEENRVDEDLLRFVAGLLPMKPLLKGLGNENPTEEEICKVLRDKLPSAYLRSLISKVVASECVYREGMEYFQDATLAVEYVKAVQSTSRLVQELEANNQTRAAQLLKFSGARTLVEFAKQL